MATATSAATRPIYEIAVEIRDDWRPLYFGARPYVVAMLTLVDLSSKYYEDPADEIVLRFLNNAATWRGETAKRVKAELRAMLKKG